MKLKCKKMFKMRKFLSLILILVLGGCGGLARGQQTAQQAQLQKALLISLQRNPQLLAQLRSNPALISQLQRSLRPASAPTQIRPTSLKASGTRLQRNLSIKLLL